MKATELRIGNLVHGINRRSKIHLPDYYPYKVLQIKLFNTEILPIEQNPATVEKWFKITNEDLSPIPLTEEWLLKLGFDHYTNSYYLRKTWGENGIVIIKYSDHYKKYTFEPGMGLTKVIEYVHQLQNLYFALTGEELNIK